MNFFEENHSGKSGAKLTIKSAHFEKWAVEKFTKSGNWQVCRTKGLAQNSGGGGGSNFQKV